LEVRLEPKRRRHLYAPLNGRLLGFTPNII